MNNSSSTIKHSKNTAKKLGTKLEGQENNPQAKEAIERKLVKLQGDDTDWYDAKHGANRSIFGDLRKMNNKKPVYVDYQYGDKDTDGFTVDGYYETSDPDIVIANITYFPTNDSPYELWEYQHKDEIGL